MPEVVVLPRLAGGCRGGGDGVGRASSSSAKRGAVPVGSGSGLVEISGGLIDGKRQ
jgi:hypothetical protein